MMLDDYGAHGEIAPHDPSLLESVYDELREVARAMMRAERVGHTLQATAIVHEAYLRLARSGATQVMPRDQFVGLAAQTMRRVLVDHARKHNSLKRGGNGMRLTLDEVSVPGTSLTGDVLEVDEALSNLSAMHERCAQVFEIRFFGGLSTADTARVMGTSVKRVSRDWRFARAYLARQLDEARAG